MAESASFEELDQAISGVLEAETTNFIELAEILGLDPKRDFAGVDLSGTDLSGCDLSFADFAGTNLSRANLSSTNLSYADLRGAILEDVDLSSTNLQGTFLADAEHHSTRIFARLLRIVIASFLRIAIAIIVFISAIIVVANNSISDTTLTNVKAVAGAIATVILNTILYPTPLIITVNVFIKPVTGFILHNSGIVVIIVITFMISRVFSGAFSAIRSFVVNIIASYRHWD